ncbi:YfhL family 4Fe-4S dicluster ferredoxin [Alteromonas sp. KUL49]|uniref:YfhL family 4Fe-4S dicluster ferredoxin n=1 Tax=Alteromonas sp. KUL49 TaxID=2480798 RepID=UPI00102F1ADF|nr:YfhL family 4Fe-4S dicluster ferredoxin [Alteromonas sp. KUL49]TAP39019.1 YfhL family 4Fe-4S dicluster ferredoxin [Alteromonas sp. KUL49]GEA12470.1 ferredoxin [Alteromonas sp. KUL49]
MALKITEECINCELCEDECPNQAISSNSEIFVIDPNRCTECIGHYDEPSCIAACPVECIEKDPAHTESLSQLADKYAAMHC